MLSFYLPIVEKATSKIPWGVYWGDSGAILGLLLPILLVKTNGKAV